MTKRRTRGGRMNAKGSSTNVDLASFLKEKLKDITYRDLEAHTGVSRGALEAIVHGESKFPTMETLTRIAKSYGKPLWEVVQMAGADLELPGNDTNRARRLAQLVSQYPKIEHLANRLMDKAATNPGYVDGIIMGLEASLGANPDDSAQ